MSPEGRAAAAVLARLRAEISTDRGHLERHLTDARDVVARWSHAPGRPDLALAAVALHGWYTSLELLWERIGRQLDQEMPVGESWHRDLLFQMTTEIPQVRPPVVPAALRLDLDELRSFRHFFRHGYSVAPDLEPVRLRRELDRLLRIGSEVARALEAFDQFLADEQSSLAGPKAG